MAVCLIKRKMTTIRNLTKYEILKAFRDEAQKKADEFSEKFPVGTFVKEWFERDEWFVNS